MEEIDIRGLVSISLPAAPYSLLRKRESFLPFRAFKIHFCHLKFGRTGHAVSLQPGICHFERSEKSLNSREILHFTAFRSV